MPVKNLMKETNKYFFISMDNNNYIKRRNKDNNNLCEKLKLFQIKLC